MLSVKDPLVQFKLEIGDRFPFPVTVVFFCNYIINYCQEHKELRLSKESLRYLQTSVDDRFQNVMIHREEALNLIDRLFEPFGSEKEEFIGFGKQDTPQRTVEKNMLLETAEEELGDFYFQNDGVTPSKKISPKRAEDLAGIIQHQENVIAREQERNNELWQEIGQFKKENAQLKSRNRELEKENEILQSQLIEWQKKATENRTKNQARTRMVSLGIQTKEEEKKINPSLKNNIESFEMLRQIQVRDKYIQSQRRILLCLQELLRRRMQQETEEVPSITTVTQEKNNIVMRFSSQSAFLLFSFSLWLLGVLMAIFIVHRENANYSYLYTDRILIS